MPDSWSTKMSQSFPFPTDLVSFEAPVLLRLDSFVSDSSSETHSEQPLLLSDESCKCVQQAVKLHQFLTLFEEFVCKCHQRPRDPQCNPNHHTPQLGCGTPITHFLGGNISEHEILSNPNLSLETFDENFSWQDVSTWSSLTTKHLTNTHTHTPQNKNQFQQASKYSSSYEQGRQER